MKWWQPCGMLMSAVLMANPTLASDLDNAPPAFAKDGLHVPIDIEAVSIHYTFDYATRRARGEAKMRFTMGDTSGFPVFDLVPHATELRLNGKDLPPSALTNVRPPDDATTLRSLAVELAAASQNELVLVFDITSEVTFQGGAAKVGFFTSDLSDRQFFEQYGPTNLEYDRIAYDFTVSVVGTETEHVLFANGNVTATGPNQWKVVYPDYFGASSLYFHLSAKNDFVVKEFTYEGVAATFPVTIYAKTASSVNEAYGETLKTLRTLEQKLGPYAHDRLIIYVAGSGGMEYCGATMTSVWALPHEITHSWYARGVMPVDGNSGWIDEAIASWQDNGFRSAGREPNRAAVNLASFSPYRRHTTMAAYTAGEQLIAEFEHVFRDQGGMGPVLLQLFSEKRRDRITVDSFQRFVERETGVGLQAIFDRYVYGKTTDARGESIVVPEKKVGVTEIVGKGHPRPYTRAELTALR